MNDYILLKRYPEIKELISIFRYEVQKSKRPANEIILNDQDVMKMLQISKRKLQYLKADGIFPIYKVEPNSPRTYYLLGDILEVMKKNRIDPITTKF